jgi:hypothetical protein
VGAEKRLLSSPRSSFSNLAYLELVPACNLEDWCRCSHLADDCQAGQSNLNESSHTPLLVGARRSPSRDWPEAVVAEHLKNLYQGSAVARIGLEYVAESALFVVCLTSLLQAMTLKLRYAIAANFNVSRQPIATAR